MTAHDKNVTVEYPCTYIHTVVSYGSINFKEQLTKYREMCLAHVFLRLKLNRTKEKWKNAIS